MDECQCRGIEVAGAAVISMKVLVAYMSKTGNTKKVAEAIYSEISHEKEIKRIEKVTDISPYDFFFLGFPMRQFGPDKKSKELIKKFCPGGKKVALFVTHGSPENGEELPKWLDSFRQATAGADLVGMFDCQGQMSGVVKFFLRTSRNPKHRMWAKMDSSQGKPDAPRLEKARAFARETMLELEKSGAVSTKR